MTDCPNGELRDLLPGLLHGRLEDADRRMVEAHLARCADCRAELELLRQLRGTLRRAPAVDVAAIVAAIPPYRAPARRSWGGGGWRAAAAVALIAVGGTSVAIANRVGDQPTRSSSPVASAQSVLTTPARPDSHAVAQAPEATPRSAAVSTPATPGAPRELAVGGAVGDLSDRELSMLLDGIESLDVLPPADVENGLPVTPVAPTTPTKGAS
jgi:anti-sigma factor RsiW